MSILLWIGIAITLLVVGLVAYWLFIITEGTYLGQPIVTWMYDLVAKRYDSIKGFDADIEAAYLGRPLAAELALMQARIVLDVGTGTGKLPLTLLDQPRFQGRIVGIDASENMLLAAAEKLKSYDDRCWLIHQTAMRLPFIDASLDAVTMIEMMEFTPDPVKVLCEVGRVLRPGGLLLTTRRTGLDATLMPGKTYAESAFCTLLASVGMAEIRVQRWQVDYDLVWARRVGQSTAMNTQPLETLLCLNCGSTSFEGNEMSFVCGSCRQQIRILDGSIRVNP